MFNSSSNSAAVPNTTDVPSVAVYSKVLLRTTPLSVTKIAEAT